MRILKQISSVGNTLTLKDIVTNIVFYKIIITKDQAFSNNVYLIKQKEVKSIFICNLKDVNDDLEVAFCGLKAEDNDLYWIRHEDLTKLPIINRM